MGKNDTQNNTLTLLGGTSTYLAHTLLGGTSTYLAHTLLGGTSTYLAHTLLGGTSTYLAHTLYMGVPWPPAYIFSSYSRAVIKRRGLGISPGYYERLPRLLSKENKRKIEPKEVPSCLIPCLLVVFTRQPEILVTTMLQPWYLMF